MVPQESLLFVQDKKTRQECSILLNDNLNLVDSRQTKWKKLWSQSAIVELER